MPATIQVGKTATGVFQEFDGPGGTGKVVPPVGVVSFASDNTAVATVDPGTGVCTGLTPGTANISAKDAGDNLTASDVLTVVDVAVSATLNLTAN